MSLLPPFSAPGITHVRCLPGAVFGTGLIPWQVFTLPEPLEIGNVYKASWFVRALEEGSSTCAALPGDEQDSGARTTEGLQEWEFTAAAASTTLIIAGESNRFAVVTGVALDEITA